jgi:hypothetical protein
MPKMLRSHIENEPFHGESRVENRRRWFMDEKQMSIIVEQYNRLGNEVTGDIKVTRVPDWKSVFVETIGETGWAIVMTEYKVDGKIYWAGFSTRSQTVYVSHR